MTSGTQRNDHDHPHHGAFDQQTVRIPIAEAELDRHERSVLDSLRLFSTSYANPGTQAWESAFENCFLEFGSTHGPRIGFAIMNVMRTLRYSRNTTFMFTNPGCSCCRETISEHENHMMALVKAERAGDGIARQTHAVILCEGSDSRIFLTNIRELADYLNEFSSSFCGRGNDKSSTSLTSGGS